MFQSSMQSDDDFDQEPGEDEIHEYAIIIGIDPVKEPELMWIARAGITAPLPPEWKPIQTNDNDLYFCNSKTGETSWEHPSDDKYRQMVLEERQSSALKNQIGSKSLKRENSVASSSNTLNKAPSSLPSTSTNTLGKPGARLAPVGLTPATIPNSAPPRVLGKLEPLSGSNKDPPPKFTPTPPKPSPQISNPSANKSQPPERPRTSRGTNDRSSVQSEPPPVQREAREALPPQQVVGGGSRFLKKPDAVPQTPVTTTVKADVLKIEPPKRKVIGKMDYDTDSEDEDDEDEDETPSSVLSGPLDGELAGDSHLFLNVDHLTPSKVEPKVAKPSSNNETKPLPQTKQQPPKSQSQPSAVSNVQPVVSNTKSTAPTTKTDASEAKTDPSTVKSDPPAKKATDSANVKVEPKPTVSAQKTDSPQNKPVTKPTSNLVQQNQTLLEENKLKNEHENRLKELKLKLTNEEEMEKKKISDEMKERLKKYRTELEQNEVKQKNEIKFQHEKVLNDLKSKLQNERKQLEKETGEKIILHDDEEGKKLTSARISYDEQLEEMKKKFETDKVRLSNEFESELAKIKTDFDAKAIRERQILESEKNEKLKLLKIQFDKEIADERLKFETEKNNKSLQLKRELDEIEKDIESEKSRLDSEKANLRANEKKFMEEKTKEMQEQIETEVAKRKLELKLKHDREVDDMQAEFEIHLTKLRREFKEKLATEEEKIKHEKQKEIAANDTESHLNNLRRELNSLSELAKNLKSSIGDVQEASKQADISKAPLRSRSKTRTTDSKRKEFINSLDNFLSHEEESSGSTPIERRLEMLESEDIVSKVQRFLASHDASLGKKVQSFDQRYQNDSFDQRRPSAGTDVGDYSNLVRSDGDFRNLVDGVKPTGNRSNISVKDALNTLQKDLKALSFRVSSPNPINYGPNRNIFRLQPRDAVDNLVESKFRQYFSDAYSIPPDRQRSNFQSGNRRTNVAQELDALKNWLEKFENDVAERKISSDVEPLDDGFA